MYGRSRLFRKVNGCTASRFDFWNAVTDNIGAGSAREQVGDSLEPFGSWVKSKLINSTTDSGQFGFSRSAAAVVLGTVPRTGRPYERGAV